MENKGSRLRYSCLIRLSEWLLGASVMEQGVGHFSEFNILAKWGRVLPIGSRWE